ncbi:alpha/beta fold hydrolase [soil metagenome]
MSAPREVDVELPTHTARVLEWGDPGAPLVLALHGFPDSAWTWRHLGPALAERCYRVAAPFTRGYFPSGVPSDRCYTVGALMADAVALHERLGGDSSSVLVGHDWGAITANALAAHPGSPFALLVSIAVPPLPAMNPTRATLLPWANAVARQPRKSWYILLNQLPGVSETRLDRLVPYLWRTWSPGHDGAEDVSHTLATVPDAAHATAVVSYYRAFLRPGPGGRSYTSWMRTLNDRPRVPLLYLSGDRDGCLEPRLSALAGRNLPEHCRAEVVPGVGHFLQVEEPSAVNARIAAFLDEA